MPLELTKETALTLLLALASLHKRLAMMQQL